MSSKSFLGTIGILTITASLGCGRNSPQEMSSHLNVVIGDTEMTPVEFDGGGAPTALRSQLEAIGQTNNHCTAFHLGGGVVVTAGHCVNPPTSDINKTPCQNLSVAWGVTYNRPTLPKISRCLHYLAYALDSDRDFAILKMDPPPSASLHVKLDDLPLANRWLAILGHPEGKPLYLSHNCNFQSASFAGRGADEFSHQCDTLPGNSGSPVFDAVTYEVIGIHNGGEGEWNYGTLLARTPIERLLADVTHQDESEPDLSKDMIGYGPFQNNENTLLAALTSQKGDSVSFAVHFNIEESFDVLNIVDGLGQTKQLTGTGNKSFSAMKTPVTISIKTDYAGLSQGVQLENISFITP